MSDLMTSIPTKVPTNSKFPNKFLIKKKKENVTDEYLHGYKVIFFPFILPRSFFVLINILGRHKS